MKRIIKTLFSCGETRKDVLLYEAEMISGTSKYKQDSFIKKMRQIKRKNEQFAQRTILKFNW